MICPVCTCETDVEHGDTECVTALIDSNLFRQTPWFTRMVPPPENWTDREREFANTLALQGIRWKKAELNS